MQQFKSIVMILLSTIIGGIGSYLYHPVMNAYLEVSDFARFESLIGIFAILTTITAGFGLYLTRSFSQSLDTQVSLYKGSQRVFFYLGITIYLIYLCFVSWIDGFLMIGNWMIVAMIGLVIPFSFISIASNSWIQSHGKFGFFSIYSMISPFGKLLFGWMFVVLGFGIFGAIGGFLLSSSIAALVLVVWVWRLVGKETPIGYSEVLDFFWKGKVELIHFFLLAFLLAVLQNLDLILVNRFFSGEIAGKYALMSIIMKFVIFLAASVEIVYYPKLSHINFYKKDLFSAIIFLITGSVFGFFVLNFLGSWILPKINPVFTEFNELIPYFYIFCILFAWISFFMKIAISHKLYMVNVGTFLMSFGLFIYLETSYDLSMKGYIYSYIITLSLILFFTISVFLYHVFFVFKKLR